jgi:hypothetical protein
VRRLVLPLVLVGAGVLGLVGVVSAAGGGPESFLRDRCQRGPVEQDPNGNRAQTYACRETPSRLAAALADEHAPADRRSTPEGHFLRYSDDMVGIVGGDQGGSKVFVADERRGYAFFYPFVGGYWGTFSGPGESFRGGGPGGGK